MEHVSAFGHYSRFKVWNLNTELGFPQALRDLEFEGILLHYSLFGPTYMLNDAFLNYLERSRSSYKVAFFQDEHRFCRQRFVFVNELKIDCVYTLVEPPYWKDTYEKYTKVPKMIYTIPGYVSEALVQEGFRKAVPDEIRGVDVGYRGRRLEFYMGKGAQEKHNIAVGFVKRAKGLGLKLDIETEERKRLYGKAWHRFVGKCKAVLGVEAGVSIFDVEDVVYPIYRHLILSNPETSFDEMSEKVLKEWEDRIPYRTISPRHFEAAALRTCQILYEGKYSGIMQPMVHYIPLKKDFSNFEEVMNLFRDRNLRSELTKNAYRDLIASGQHSYRRFIQGTLDQSLMDSGLRPGMTTGEVDRVTSLLNRGANRRKLYAACRSVPYRQFPGRDRIVPLVRLVWKKYCGSKQSHSYGLTQSNS
jgi:hypothetical protein